jgi:hypothetical protein
VSGSFHVGWREGVTWLFVVVLEMIVLSGYGYGAGLKGNFGR